MEIICRQKVMIIILPDNEMPRVNGMVAEIVILSASIVKRGTTSQIIEAACGYYDKSVNWNATIRSESDILSEYEQS